jgi:hypothetical protein
VSHKIESSNILSVSVLVQDKKNTPVSWRNKKEASGYQIFGVACVKIVLLCVALFASVWEYTIPKTLATIQVIYIHISKFKNASYEYSPHHHSDHHRSDFPRHRVGNYQHGRGTYTCTYYACRICKNLHTAVSLHIVN